MKALVYQIQLESASPISFSKFHGLPKLDQELSDAYEQRTWREKVLTDKDGNVMINAMALKFALCSAAKYLGRQIPGKGKRTYAKIFDSAILCVDNLNLGVKKEDTIANWVYVNADGKRGSGTRVMRCFPTLPNWSSVAKLYVLDQTITQQILMEHLEAAGLFIGLGQFRVERGGTNGRFRVESIKVIAG